MARYDLHIAALRTAAEHLEEGIVVYRPDATIEYVNPSCARMHGYRIEELTGRPIGTLYTRMTGHRPTLEQAWLPPARATEEYHVRKDGTTFPCRVWFERLKDDVGNVTGYVGTIRDITERRHLEEKRRAVQEQSNQLKRLKAAFLANMSHELRTPLTLILGYTEVLKEEFQGEGGDLLGIIDRNASRLMETLNNVLDLAQIESEALQPVMITVNITHELDYIVTQFHQHLQERNLTLQLQKPDGPLYVTLDTAIFNRVLSNLISNAIKFTDQGVIQIALTDQGDEVAVHIRDTGVGISREFKPYIYEAFKQESTGLTRHYEGCGLGLTVTRRLLEIMNGRITFDSKKGDGSTFTIHLPKLPQ